MLNRITIAVFLLAAYVPTAYTTDRESPETLTPGAYVCVPASGSIHLKAGSIEYRMSTLKPDGALPGIPSADGILRIVREGSVSYAQADGGTAFAKGDVISLDGSAGRDMKAGGEGAVVADVTFLGVGGGATPSLEPGGCLNIDRLQFCQPEEGADARVVAAAHGQVCFVRYGRDMTFPSRTITAGRLIHVVRGRMDVTVNGSTVPLETGSILYVGENSAVSFATGPRGCDVITAVSPSDPIITRAVEEREAAFRTLLAPGVEPVLLVDGERDKPGLTFTEGPSWMNGRFYFSNYYKFWKPWGSSDEGGVWIVEQDNSFRLLNMNVQTCGTTPLPNGKLAVCDLFARAVVEMDPETGEMGREIVGSYDGVPFAVANDVITDRRGGLYVTDSSVAKEGPSQPGTALYYHNSAGKTIRVTEPNEIEYINGVALTPDDRTLYLNGSGEEYVWAFDVNPDGALSNKRPFARLRVPDAELDREKPRSVADGMTIDRNGSVYVATPFGVQVFDSSGGFTGILHFPQNPSHCVFGGPDMKTLYVTARNRVYSLRTERSGFQYPIQ